MFSQRSFLLAIVFSFIFWGSCIAQSPNYSVSSELISVPLDSITNEQKIQLTINFTDINSIGGLAFSVYDSQEGTFLVEVNAPITELVNLGLISGSEFKMVVIPYVIGRNVRFDINPYNSSSTFIERTELVTTF
jgi:hypothetical protein